MQLPFHFQRQVYLDNNATTEPWPTVVKVVEKTLRKAWGNPSSQYRIAHDSARILEDARVQLAKCIHAGPEEILFTGCASEANNQVLKMLAELKPHGRTVLLSTPIEHASVLSSLVHLQSRGVAVQYLSVDTWGRVNEADLRSKLNGNVALVCMMLANNETGVVQNIAALTRLAHDAGAFVLCDCVQALGKIPVDVQALGVDYASFSAHKIHGPKGIGALYVRKGAPLAPFIHGGHQEHGMRAGTESTHNIAGFSEALRLLAPDAAVRELVQELRAGIVTICPHAVLHSAQEQSLPNTLSVQFPGTANSVLMGFLDYRGIAVSAGSACNTQANEPSHVLTALGLDATAARETIRFSLASSGPHATQASDVRYVLRALEEFFGGRAPSIGMLSPAQLDEKLLFQEDTWIFDVRHGYDRMLLKSLPGAHEASFPYRCHYSQVPKHKHIVVVCQAGFDAPVVAYALRARGVAHVSFVMAGMLGWKLQNAELYQKYAGKNIHVLARAEENP